MEDQWNEILDRNLIPMESTITLMFHGYKVAKLPNKTMDLVEFLKQKQIPLKSSSYTSIISTLNKVNGLLGKE